MKQLILLSCVLSIALASSIEWTGTNTGKDVLVSWTYTSNSITFTVTANTTGWIGLGFSPSGSMAGADIIMGWVDGSGTGFVRDCFATANAAPTIDGSQDVTLDSSSEADGQTTLTYTRALDTGDSLQDNMILPDTTRLILAFGISDPVDSSQLAFADVHADKGTRSVYLLEPVQNPIVLPDDIQSFQVRASNKTIPHADDTLYWCTFHKLPTLQQKHHVVQVNPIIETLGHVHHILVYGCHGLTAAEIETAGANDNECYTSNMPDFAEYCTAVIAAWAIGGGTYEYPENAGWPIGPESGAPDYLLMEIHYDNPNFHQGEVDSSGLEFIYTPTLRQYDAAVLEIGSVGGIVVPPGADAFVITGYCSGECTQSMIQVDEGITVFSYMLHAHLLGAGIRLNLYRDGAFHSVLAYDDYYDFNFQSERTLAEPVVLLPGDTLEVRCTMNPTGRSDLTFGGLRSSEEMCLAFLSYYPKQNAGICRSYPDFAFNPTSQFYTNLGVQASTYPGSSFVDIYTALSGVTWTESNLTIAQDSYYESPYVQECTGTGDDTYPIHFNGTIAPPPPGPNDGNGGEQTTQSSAVALQCTLLTFLSVLAMIF